MDAVSGMFDEVSPRSFTLIDEQKLAYETVMDAVRTTPVNDKHCVIIAGGPGTGKSVVAMSALVAILRVPQQRKAPQCTFCVADLILSYCHG